MDIVTTYGQAQRFRARTDDLNVIGKVVEASYPIRLATWQLNDATPIPFYVEEVADPGLDWTFEYKLSPAVNRLKDQGDFNIEIPTSHPALVPGPNNVHISVRDEAAAARLAIEIIWDPTPLPAELDLSDLSRFGHIQEVGQVVDGAFDLDRDLNLIRSRAPVYPDSLLVLGSAHPSQEATYAVRFTDFTKVKWLGPSDFFAGHAGPEPPIGIKPGWSTAGLVALNPRNEARMFLAYGDHVGTAEEWVVQTMPPVRFYPKPNVWYRCRHQVLFKDGVDRSRFRIWKTDEREPEDWLLEESDADVPVGRPRYRRASFSLFQHSGFPNEWADIRLRPID